MFNLVYQIKEEGFERRSVGERLYLDSPAEAQFPRSNLEVSARTGEDDPQGNIMSLEDSI